MTLLIHRIKLVLKYATCGLLLQMFFVQFLFAQSIAVTGKVTATDSPEGLPGVTILLKGTAQGTTSDVNGDYRIEVPNTTSDLVFSSIGYSSQEITVGNQNTINVSLV